MLKTVALARVRLHCVGRLPDAGTSTEIQSRKNAALERRLQKVLVEEPSARGHHRLFAWPEGNRYEVATHKGRHHLNSAICCPGGQC